MHTVGRRKWRHGGARGGIGLHEFEELHVVVNHLLECAGAVVVKVRRGLSDATKSGNVELLPVVQWGGAADEPGQQGAPGIGALSGPQRPRSNVCSYGAGVRPYGERPEVDGFLGGIDGDVDLLHAHTSLLCEVNGAYSAFFDLQ